MKCLYALAVVVAAFVVAGGCSREEKRPVRKTCDAVKAMVRGIYRLENAVTNDAARPRFVTLDVVEMTADELKKKFLECGDLESAHLWMPGEISWVVVCHKAGTTVSLAKAMDAVADDPSCTVSLPEVFASYVGTLAEIMPAFENKLEGSVVPEWFVPEVVTAIPWIDGTGVEDDILKSVSDEVRSMRNVRREVLKGNMMARKSKNKKGDEKACEFWSRAALRNPHDSLLLERISNLEQNARAFLEGGMPVQAMKCFETVILIQPKNASAVHNFGLCLKKIGKKDLAEQVLKRAEVLKANAELEAK